MRVARLTGVKRTTLWVFPFWRELFRVCPILGSIWKPALSAYMAPRRLRVRRAVGCFWQPKAGLLPGCALAVFFLALVTRPWQVAIERVDHSLKARLHVDDATFWAGGKAGHVTAMAQQGLQVTLLSNALWVGCLIVLGVAYSPAPLGCELLCSQLVSKAACPLTGCGEAFVSLAASSRPFLGFVCWGGCLSLLRPRARWPRQRALVRLFIVRRVGDRLRRT